MNNVTPWPVPTPFISKEKIAARVLEISKKINEDYAGKEITAICVLKGSICFYTDLIRAIERPVYVELLGLSSYGNQTVSTGEVKVTLDLKNPIDGKHILIVEDIVDSGLTLAYTMNQLKLRRPASVKCATFLSKPSAIKPEIRDQISLDYVGFEIPNRFVVGYGLDYAEKYRGIPYVGTLDDLE